MKKSNLLKLVVSAAMVGVVGCAEESADTSSAVGMVSTPLVMTGAGATNVVFHQYKAFGSIASLFQFIVPQANAYTPAVIVDANGATVTLSSAWVVIKEIEFKANEVADGAETTAETEVELEGPYFVDLLSNNPVALGTVTVPATGIRRIKMKLHESGDAVIPTDAPAEIANNSIVLSGSVGGNSFRFLSDDGTEFEIGGSNAIIPTSAADLLVAIRLADLFSKINLNAVTNGMDIHSGNRVSGTNQCPLIDVSAESLYDCFRKGLENEADFGKDNDGDHEFEAEDEEVEEEDAE